MDGVLRNDGDRVAVRFERDLPASPAEVWAALTEPTLLVRWLARAEVELEVGGVVSLRFDDGAMEGGRILALDPPRLLEYEWNHTGEPPSVVRFELAPTAAGTRLVLDHRLLGSETGPGYGAGWQAHLEALDAVLAGGDPGDWWRRFETLRPTYEAQAAALP
jgi:uncharacterized protein YndB with AHSA1/START domain